MPEKQGHDVGLALTEESLSEVLRYVLVYMPLSAAALGAFVMLRRRGKEKRSRSGAERAEGKRDEPEDEYEVEQRLGGDLEPVEDEGKDLAGSEAEDAVGQQFGQRRCAGCQAQSDRDRDRQSSTEASGDQPLAGPLRIAHSSHRHG